LTLDERNDAPFGWMPDNKTVLFISDRSGSFNLYKQALEQDAAEHFVALHQTDLRPTLSPDSKWILYVRFAKLDDFGTSTLSPLMRVPISGGPAQPVLTAHGWNLHNCARAPASLCLVGERTEDQKQLVFTAFDPVKGRGREVARIETKPGPGYPWDLSPDGSKIVMSFPAGENRIRLLPVAGGEPHDLVVREWSRFISGADWAADGRGFYVSSRSPARATLLYIDLNGHARAMWEQKGSFTTWARPSPDGRHLAILGDTVDSNVWMIENF
jgi:Tol biopolymer transport system component